MRQHKKNRLSKIARPPGELVPVDDVPMAQSVVSLIAYDGAAFSEQGLSIEELNALNLDVLQATGKCYWLNVHGLHDVNLIKCIGELFHLHPLVQEDILNTEQRPKIDAFEDYVFLETRSFYYHRHGMQVSSEQISIVLGSYFLLTFQERSTGIFASIRERLRTSRSHIRALGVDYLAYSLLDNIVDQYFKVLEEVSEDSEILETALLHKPSNTNLQSIHQLKHVSIELRRAVWPLRELINNLSRNDSDFFKPATMPYLRDVYDHTVNFIESLESIRDALSSMMDIYMASVSHRVNLELRALTVVAMMFMPATLIAGIFGMNFHRMPWLDEPNGFWWSISLMACIAFVMMMIFWRRQWLGNKT